MQGKKWWEKFSKMFEKQTQRASTHREQFIKACNYSNGSHDGQHHLGLASILFEQAHCRPSLQTRSLLSTPDFVCTRYHAGWHVWSAGPFRQRVTACPKCMLECTSDRATQCRAFSLTTWTFVLTRVQGDLSANRHAALPTDSSGPI